MIRREQILRQWRVLASLARRPSGLTVNELAEQLGVAWETIHRDLEALAAAGFPLFDEPQEGVRRWRFVDGYRLRTSMVLSFADLAALEAASEVLGALGGPTFAQAYASLRKRVREAFPAEAEAFLEALRGGLWSETMGSARAVRRRHLSVLAETIRVKRSIEIRYDHDAGGESNLRLDPLRLWHHHGDIFLIARDHVARALRTLAVDRIRRLQALELPFETPEGFSLDAYLAGDFEAAVLGETWEVRVRFAPSLAALARERLWHPTQSVHPRPDGTVDVRLRVADLEAARSWVSSFGARARVLALRQLLEMVAGDLRMAAAAYADAVEGEASPEPRTVQLSLF